MTFSQYTINQMKVVASASAFSPPSSYWKAHCCLDDNYKLQLLYETTRYHMSVYLKTANITQYQIDTDCTAKQVPVHVLRH